MMKDYYSPSKTYFHWQNKHILDNPQSLGLVGMASGENPLQEPEMLRSVARSERRALAHIPGTQGMSPNLEPQHSYGMTLKSNPIPYPEEFHLRTRSGRGNRHRMSTTICISTQRDSYPFALMQVFYPFAPCKGEGLVAGTKRT